MKTERKTNSKDWVTFILGEPPTLFQKTFVWLMIISLLLWPPVFFMSIFFWDAPIRSTADAICRWGMTLTIWLYPIYIFILIRLSLKLSKKLRMAWLFYFSPLVPVAVFCLFYTLGISAYADRKPDGCDPSTYERINATYSMDVNHVYYEYDILPFADPCTFKVLSDYYAIDMHHVWFKDIIIYEADPATFVVPDRDISNLAHDAHDYYMEYQPLHVADMSSFKQIDYKWAIDSLYVYYLDYDVLEDNHPAPIGDYSTFKVLTELYALDSTRVYYKNKVVEGADPSSFAVMNEENHYAQDKHRVYCEDYGSEIRDLKALRHKSMDYGLCKAFHTDGTTVYNYRLLPMPKGTDFTAIDRVDPYCEWYSDKKRVYYENRILPGANPKTFKVFPLYHLSEDKVTINKKSATYSSDGRHVYHCDSLISGVDIASFVCGYDFVGDQSFAFDKNQYYEGRQNVRTEKLRNGEYDISQ